MKWLVRLFGFCGHEREWSEMRGANIDGKSSTVQYGVCTRCGKIKIREIYA